jgi:hypothetical protein
MVITTAERKDGGEVALEISVLVAACKENRGLACRLKNGTGLFPRSRGKGAIQKSLLALVDPIPQNSRRLKGNHSPGIQGEFFTCLRISPSSGALVFDIEFAETAEQQI